LHPQKTNAHTTADNSQPCLTNIRGPSLRGNSQ
jgi:hypothetical protein